MTVLCDSCSPRTGCMAEKSRTECRFYQPMTNEEWLKSLDTEGLVDYLFEVHKCGSSVERQRWIEEHKERIKMQIRGWLKEKHNDIQK